MLTSHGNPVFCGTDAFNEEGAKILILHHQPKNKYLQQMKIKINLY